MLNILTIFIYIILSFFYFHSQNGELEEQQDMPDLPKMLTLESFRNAILEKFNDRLGIDHVISIISNPYTTH